MKRMHLILTLSAAALAVGGFLVVRHAIRTAPIVPPESDLPAPPRKKVQPIDSWQAAIRPDTRTDYTPDPVATRCLQEKLQREEMRQRPQEGRN